MTLAVDWAFDVSYTYLFTVCLCEKNSETELTASVLTKNPKHTKHALLCCTLLEKEDFVKYLHVLTCFVQLKSVLLISCVFLDHASLA